MESPEIREAVESHLGKEFRWIEVDEGVNEIYVLESREEDLVLKVQTAAGNEIEESVQPEPVIYRTISEETDVPSPEIIHEDFSRETRSFYIMQKMPGSNPVKAWPEMKQETRKELVRQYGGILGEIHSLRDFTEHGPIRNKNGELEVTQGSRNWPEVLKEKIRNWREKINRDGEIMKITEPDPDFGKIPDAREPVLIHEDNRLDNLLVQDSRITAFLDWSGPESGPRRYDLARAEYYLIDGDATFPGKNILKDEQKKSLRKELLRGYRETNQLEENWMSSKERKIYRYTSILDIASGFSEWARDFEPQTYEKTREELASKLRAEKRKLQE